MEQRVLCINDNLSALLWRLRIIEHASRELILSTFEWKDDTSGLAVMSSLFSAAERGVQIRLFVDGVYGLLDLRDSEPFHALLSHPNVKVKFYNAIRPSNIRSVVFRMHDKYLIADDSVYMLGGRNTYDYFLGDSPGKKNIDRDLLVYESDVSETDSSLAAVKAYFASIWALPCNKKVTCPGNKEDLQKGKYLLEETYQALRKQYPSAFEKTDFRAATFAVNHISLLTNPQAPKHKEPTLWHQLCRQMTGRKDVLVQTPYIICGKDMYADLTSLCAKTEHVRILINAVENGANPWGCTDYLNQKKNILKTGATVYEFIGEHSVHTKTVLIDENLSIVGSFNMDMRSAYLDTEMMLAVDSRELNAQLRTIAEQEMQQCREVSPDGTEKNGSAYVPVELSPKKKRFYFCLRNLIRPVRSLL